MWASFEFEIQEIKPFLSPASLELTGLTGKEKLQNVPAWSWSLFFLGSSLRTLRALREKNVSIFCSFGHFDCGSAALRSLRLGEKK